MSVSVRILRHLYLYGSYFTVSFAVKTGSTFMGVNHYRRLVKPFEDPILAGFNTHPAARATIIIDLYSNVCIENSLVSYFFGIHFSPLMSIFSLQ